jgi:hypothetical protein
MKWILFVYSLMRNTAPSQDINFHVYCFIDNMFYCTYCNRMLLYLEIIALLSLSLFFSPVC